MAHILDEIDWKIVTLLQSDGRVTNVEIARQVGVTEGTVRNRIERLLSEGAIRIYAGVSPEMMGFPRRLILGVRVQWDQAARVAERLAAMPEVRAVALAVGRYNLVAEVLCRSDQELQRFLTDDIGGIPGVQEVDAIQVLSGVKETFDWRLPGVEGREEAAVEQPRKILLVDDDPLFVGATQLVLEGAGYRVNTAKTIDRALAMMREERPDLVILDIMLESTLDGVYASEMMFEDESLRDIPVVMVSSIASTQYASHFPTDGYLHAVDFLFKPVQPSALLESIERYLS